MTGGPLDKAKFQIGLADLKLNTKDVDEFFNFLDITV